MASTSYTQRKNHEWDCSKTHDLNTIEPPWSCIEEIYWARTAQTLLLCILPIYNTQFGLQFVFKILFREKNRRYPWTIQDSIIASQIITSCLSGRQRKTTSRCLKCAWEVFLKYLRSKEKAISVRKSWIRHLQHQFLDSPFTEGWLIRETFFFARHKNGTFNKCVFWPCKQKYAISRSPWTADAFGRMVNWWQTQIVWL